MAYTNTQINLHDLADVDVDRRATDRGDWEVTLLDAEKQTYLHLGLSDESAQALLVALLECVGEIPEDRLRPLLQAYVGMTP